MQKKIKGLGWGLLAVFFLSGQASAAGILTNGGFESGNYTGWTLREGAPDFFGTWGIVNSGQTVSFGGQIYDFCDSIQVAQNSSGLPRTYQPSEGVFMAIQLQNGGQEHRMYQDVTLPENVSALSWDMFFDNKLTFFAPDQFLAVNIRDLEDNILETLYLSYDNDSQQIPMSNFIYDISAYAGKTVRIDVQLNARKHYFDAGFDNFQILVSPSQDPTGEVVAPPGWSKSSGKKLGWVNKKNDFVPKGFEEGLKNGWNK